MEKNYDDTFLARWVAGELSSEELIEFKKSPEYSEYEMINEGANRLEAPSYDRQNAWNTLKGQIVNRPQPKQRRLPRYWAYSAAAAIILLVGYLFILPSSTEIKTLARETSSFELPDGSKIDLNASSKITYIAKGWGKNRTLNLKGEAQFQVEKGSEFLVHTDQGDVVVLGTKFVVNSRSTYFDVSCSEGKVQVSLHGKNYVLEKGDALRLQNDEISTYRNLQRPATWLHQESSFVNAPLAHVIEELERQYEIQIGPKNMLETQLFTGRFTHKNIETALQTVFEAMGINYNFDGKNVVILQR